MARRRAVLPLVIVHWNRPERAVATVAAMLAQSTPELEVRPLVVDNASPPAALAALHDGLAGSGLGHVEVLERADNGGFGPGANAGFRHLLGTDPRPRWIGLAPHDAEPGPGTVAAIVDAAEARPRAGLACGDYGDGATPVIHPYLGGVLGPATVTEGWEPADHPHGTLLVARAEMLDEVGLFDERYSSYCEEADLGLRARAAGWEVGLVRGAIVHNPDLGTRVAAIDYLQLRNTMLLIREHHGLVPAAFRAGVAVTQLAMGLVNPAWRGPYFDAGARVRALVDHARGRYGPPPPDLLAR